MTIHHTLGRQERIKSRKLIDMLFSGGNSQSLAAYPLRVVWSISPAPSHSEESFEAQQVSPCGGKFEGISILVSVSKRHFKQAVKRNRVKRQIREAYRLNKEILVPSTLHLPPSTLLLAFVWQSDEIFPTAVVEERMKNLLTRLSEKL
jgi:ribonuclease P protein component